MSIIDLVKAPLLPKPASRILPAHIDPGPLDLPHKDLAEEGRTRVLRRLELHERLKCAPWGHMSLPPLPKVRSVPRSLTVEAPAWLRRDPETRWER